MYVTSSAKTNED